MIPYSIIDPGVSVTVVCNMAHGCDAIYSMAGIDPHRITVKDDIFAGVTF